MTCQDAATKLTIEAARGTRYADVPFKPARYTLIVPKAARPGEFIMRMGLRLRGDHFVVVGRGTLELTQFDARRAVGKFAFNATTGGPTPRRVSVAGSFSFP